MADSIAKLAVIITGDASPLAAATRQASTAVKVFDRDVASGTQSTIRFNTAISAARGSVGGLASLLQSGGLPGGLAAAGIAAGLLASRLAAISDAQRVAAGAKPLDTWAGQFDRVEKSAGRLAVTLGRPIADVMARETGQVANILEGIAQQIMPQWQKEEERVLRIMEAQKAAVKALGDMKDRVVNLTKGEADAYRKIQTEMTGLLAKQQVMGGLTEAEANRFERLNKARNTLGLRREMREFDKGSADMAAEKFRELESRAKSLGESLRTPREEFVAALADAGAMFDAGVLNAQNYARAAEAAKEKFLEASKIREKSQQADRGIPAADRFTMAGFSAVQQSQRELESIEQTAKDQLEEQKRQTEVEQEIARILNERLSNPIVLTEGTPP